MTRGRLRDRELGRDGLDDPDRHRARHRGLPLARAGGGPSARHPRATSTRSRVVAYELLSGERPFERESPTAEAAAHVNAPVPSISARCENLPREIDQVFQRALAKDPRQRPRIGTGVRRRAPRRALPLGRHDAGARPNPRRDAARRACSCRSGCCCSPRAIGAAVAAIVTSGGSSKPQVVTRTVTGPAGTTTVRQTVTHQTTAAAQPPPPPTAGSRDGRRPLPERPGLLAHPGGRLRRRGAALAVGRPEAPRPRARAIRTRRSPTTTSATPSTGSAAAARRSRTCSAPTSSSRSGTSRGRS